ncbi:hypothetical protein ACOMHN_009935 [Nucella lapillus]
MKQYADSRRRAHTADIQVGDNVLVCQPRENKLTSFYDPAPREVILKKGPMITASRCGGNPITRNVAFFKKIPATVAQSQPPDPEDEEEDTTPATDESGQTVSQDSPGPAATKPAAQTSQMARRTKRHCTRPRYLEDYVP